jgi:type IV pilus assembly protein PilO
MATPFREWPLPVQVLMFVGLGVLIVLFGLFFWPVQSVRTQLEAAQARLKPLQSEVTQLRVYQQRRIELQGEMDALQKQLVTLQTIVPEDKQADQFILMLQSAAASSGVSIRKLTAKPVVAQEFYYSMPFDLEVDGPYYAVLDFFTRLSRLSRIINVGDLDLKTFTSSADKFHVTPGTSVGGTLTVTTFFTKPASQAAVTPAAAKTVTH